MGVSHGSQVPGAKRQPFSPRRRAQPGFDWGVPSVSSPRPKSLREILNAPPPAKLRHHQSWGSWRLDAERLVLEYVPDGCWRYELDIEKNHDAASVLDFIFQFYGKGWATAAVMADLLDAIYDIFDPQANLCSCGRNRCISPGEFWAARIEPPTEAERAESYRQAPQTYQVWGFPVPGAGQ